MSPRDASRKNYMIYVSTYATTGQRSVPVSSDVITRSDAFSYPTADTSDEVEANLETPNNNLYLHVFPI